MSRALQVLTRRSLQQVQAVASLFYGKPFSMLSIHSDLSGWVLDNETLEMQRIALGLGIDARINQGISAYAAQCCHYTSQFVLRNPRYFENRNRVSVDYFHGLPGTSPVFAEVYAGLRRHHMKLWRLRVAHSQMEAVALQTGIDPSKVHRIPIGVNLAYFSVQTGESRREIRHRLGLPQSAVIVGSFQKDGVGWGQGMEPKNIKGPDVFLQAIELMKSKVSELFVLLSGPARGFVRAGLERLGVPYMHLYPNDYAEVGRLFQALDIYLVASREEGGPKAVLESLASGVPLVTTKVGQAVDLVRHGENGWMVEVEDAEGLAYWAERVVSSRGTSEVSDALADGRRTAENHSYDSQGNLWQEFFRGFVETT